MTMNEIKEILENEKDPQQRLFRILIKLDLELNTLNTSESLLDSCTDLMLQDWSEGFEKAQAIYSRRK